MSLRPSVLLRGLALVAITSCGGKSGSIARSVDAGEDGTSVGDGGVDGVTDAGSDAAQPGASRAFCLAFAACGYLGLESITQCLYFGGTEGLSVEQRDCVLRAGTDCTAIAVCAGGGTARSCRLADTFSCMGTLASTCAFPAHQVVVTDCARRGLSCVDGADGPLCALGTCQRTECMGDALRYCAISPGDDAGYDFGVSDCARVGAHCAADASASGPGCVGNGPPCTSDRCSGNSIVSCFSGHEGTYPCPAPSTTCFQEDAAPPYDKGLCASATECDPFAHVDACDASILHFCDRGRLAAYDCVAAGWRTCAPPDGMALGALARCAK